MIVSIKERLKNLSRELHIDFNKLAIRYAQERLLYRLSISDYKDYFALKGALLLVIFNEQNFRPTSDIDFLGLTIHNDNLKLLNIFQHICSIYFNDGIVFQKDSITHYEIKKNSVSKGTRLKVPWYLGQMKGVLQLDIGFGDKIFSGPSKASFPSLLDFPETKILAYSKETVLSEKIQIIVSLNYETSRLKDFFDIYYLCSNNTFFSNNILSAMNLTFDNRKTSIDDFKLIFSNDFKKNLYFETQWKSFLRRNKIELTLSFESLMAKIESFFIPVLNHHDKLIWNKKKWEWEHYDHSHLILKKD